MMKFELEEANGREKLGEGRSWGVIYSYAIRNKNKLVTPYPLTACREFLNDEWWSFHTGKKYSAYNFNARPIKGLINKGLAYVVFGIGKYNGGDKYSKYDRDYKQMAENYKNLQVFLNKLEKQIGFKKFTKIVKLKDNRYVAVHSAGWCKSLWLVSLYTLLIRTAFFYDGKQDVFEYLKKSNYTSEDQYMLENVVPKLKKMTEGHIPAQDMAAISSPHSFGVVNFPLDKFGKASNIDINGPLDSNHIVESLDIKKSPAPFALQPAKF